MALYYTIQYGPLAFFGGGSPGISLGPILGVLAILSIVGYLVFLVANKTTRSRFGNITIPTFVSFNGRIRRPTFSLITAVVHVQNLIGIVLTLYVLSILTPWSDEFLLIPYGSLIDAFEVIDTSDDLTLITWVLAPLSESSSVVILFTILPIVDFLMEFAGVDYFEYRDWSFPISWLLVLQIPITYLWLALCVKRYQDLDKSGWWSLVGFIPIIGPIWILIELGLMKGTPGHNRYGPSTEHAVPGVSDGSDFSAEPGPGAVPAGQAMKACPYCGQAILYEALRCRYCYSDIPPEVDSS